MKGISLSPLTLIMAAFAVAVSAASIEVLEVSTDPKSNTSKDITDSYCASHHALLLNSHRSDAATAGRTMTSATRTTSSVAEADVPTQR